MNTKRSWRTAVVVGLVVTVLGGCGMAHFVGREEVAPVLSRQTLAEVKVVVKEIEVEIASFVPEDVRVEIREKAGGSIMDCAPGGVTWGSSTFVVVTEQPDLHELEETLRAEWHRAPDFEFDLTKGSTGEPRLVLRSATSGNFYVHRRGDGLQVASFSTCFAYDPERDGYAWEIAAE
jgi:hypothetical protein